MSAAQLQDFLGSRTLLLGLAAAGMLVVVLVPARPAAAESTLVEEVRVPYGTTSTEAYTVFGNVTVEGRVRGDVRSAFGDVVVMGPVAGEVQTGFGDVYVNSRVGGSVDVGYGDVRLGPLAHVDRNLSLGNGRSFTEAGAVVQGERRYGMMSNDSPLVTGGVALANLTLWLLTTLCFCAVAMLFAVLARRPLGASARSLERSPVRSLLMGVASLPTVALFSVLLAVTVVGAPLLLLSVPAYLALVIFGELVSAYYIGRRLLLATGSYRGGEAFASAAGAFALSVLYLVPFVGGIVLFALALLGTGAALSASLRRLSLDERHPEHREAAEEKPSYYDAYP